MCEVIASSQNHLYISQQSDKSKSCFPTVFMIVIEKMGLFCDPQ